MPYYKTEAVQEALYLALQEVEKGASLREAISIGSNRKAAIAIDVWKVLGKVIGEAKGKGGDYVGAGKDIARLSPRGQCALLKLALRGYVEPPTPARDSTATVASTPTNKESEKGLSGHALAMYRTWQGKGLSPTRMREIPRLYPEEYRRNLDAALAS